LSLYTYPSNNDSVRWDFVRRIVWGNGQKSENKRIGVTDFDLGPDLKFNKILEVVKDSKCAAVYELRY